MMPTARNAQKLVMSLLLCCVSVVSCAAITSSEHLQGAIEAHKAGNLPLAEKLVESALSGIDKEAPASAPSLIVASVMYGDILRNQSKLRQANKHYETACVVALRSVAVNPETKLKACNHYGDNSVHIGEERAALQLFIENSIGEQRLSKSRDSPELIEQKIFAIGVFIQLNMFNRNYAEVERFSREFLEQLQEVLPERRMLRADTLASLGQSVSRQDGGRRIDNAIELTKQGLDICHEVAGAQDLQCATIESNLVDLYLGIGRYAAAEKYALHALKVRKDQLGNDHPYTVSVSFVIGVSYFFQRRYDEALPLLQSADDNFSKLYGTKSGYVKTSHKYRTQCLRKLGRFEEAAALEKKKGLWVIQ